MPNYNPETKIPYGVVSLNSLAEWVYEEFFNYGENTSYADALEEWKKTNPDGEEEDFSDEYESQEDCYSLETDKMSLGLSYLGGAAMVWVFKSDHTTLASPCSPCVPGAGDLDSQHDGGIHCYTLPNDWFEKPIMANTMKAGDECPNCHCGTIEETDDEFICRGECGEIWPNMKRQFGQKRKEG